MDRPDCDTLKLRRTFAQFRLMNVLVTRYRMLITRHIISDMRSDAPRPYSILDIGAGGCDIPAWLIRHCRRLRIPLHVTAIDPDPVAVAYAIDTFGHLPELKVVQAGLFDSAELEPPYDYCIANHFLHHLAADQLLPALATIDGITDRRFLVNDLVRSRRWYVLFSAFAGLVFHRSFIYTDGKQSIRRGFLRHEMQTIIDQSSWNSVVEISTAWPGRIVISGSRK